MPITGSHIYELMTSRNPIDPDNTELERVFMEYCAAQADALQGLAKQPVTVVDLFACRLALYQVTYGQGWFSRGVETSGGDHATFLARAAENLITSTELPRCRDLLAQMRTNPPENEERLLLSTSHDGYGLNDEAITRWRAGNLTIEELFELQPTVFFPTGE